MARHRSPNYPAHGLGDAIQMAREIYAKEKRSQSPGEIIAKALGYNSLSGNARVKIASLKKYGLLEGDESRGMRISDLAMRILYPSSPVDHSDAIKTAALTPTLFKALFDEKKGASDEALTNYLISRMEFSPIGATQAIEAFRDTTRVAGLEDWGYSNSYTPDATEAQVESASMVTDRPDVTLRGMSVKRGNPDLHSWNWTLSIPRTVNAELVISGPMERRDVERLIRHLNSLKEAFDDDTESSEGR